MDVACSRDGSEKIYVQHRMKEQSRDIFAWLEEGAHVYVCGDAANMATDVHSALIDIVASEARTGREPAEDHVRSLLTGHRCQRDVESRPDPRLPISSYSDSLALTHPTLSVRTRA